MGCDIHAMMEAKRTFSWGTYWFNAGDPMITTTDPVSPHDLAEALREAASTLGEWVDSEIFDPLGASMTTTRQVQRWQSLLDRYDAQVRERLDEEIAHAMGMRDAWMARSHRTRDKGFDADIVRGDVDDARACNWQALRLRRELRALGGDA